MSGRKSAMPPTVSMLKPWQTTTRVTVNVASARAGAESLSERSNLEWRLSISAICSFSSRIRSCQ